MEALAPTPEQLARGHWQAPQRDQSTNRTAYKRSTSFERMKDLEPEHRQAALRLERHWYGSQGYDVRFDDDIRVIGPSAIDEHPQHVHAAEVHAAKRAVGSPRSWAALIEVIERNTSPRDIGHHWGARKNRDAAKGFGDALILTGLDALALHWGMIRRPDG